MGVWKTLPTWAKGTIAVVGTAVTVFAIWKGYKFVQSYIENKDARKEGKEIEKELKDLKQQGTVPTLSDSQISIMANQLHTAFDGTGTDEVAVYRVFSQVKNEADVLALIKSYGIRKIGGSLTSDFEGTLPQTMTSELDQGEISIVNGYLKRNNVQYSF